jgi:hypothetical protein
VLPLCRQDLNNPLTAVSGIRGSTQAPFVCRQDLNNPFTAKSGISHSFGSWWIVQALQPSLQSEPPAPSLSFFFFFSPWTELSACHSYDEVDIMRQLRRDGEKHV